MLTITHDNLQAFHRFLVEQEYSPATISKYLHDVRVLMHYAKDGIADKTTLIAFRTWLGENGYCGSSINSMLGAVNKFLVFLGYDHWKLKYVRVQRRLFLPADKELSQAEYERMVRTAQQQGNARLALLLQTLCALGIRVSELRHITVESLREGESNIVNKGKLRTILIPVPLAEKLLKYCKEKGITSGSVFITRTGKPIDRSNIWRMLKRLAEVARVAPKKVFPHNFRHLFAHVYYKKFKNLIYLSCLLGHSDINTTRLYVMRSGKEERRQLAELHLLL